MSEQTFPQTFVKGAESRLVRNVREAVKAKFDGFKAASAVVAETKPDYVELQAAAKAAGIPANQRKDRLVEGLVKHDTDTVEPATGDKDKADKQNDPQDPAPAARDELAEKPKPAKPSR